MKPLLAVLSLIITLSLNAQELKSPSEFLGYELGTRFTRHHQVVDYYQYLSEAAKDRVKLNEYGKTNRDRGIRLETCFGCEQKTKEPVPYAKTMSRFVHTKRHKCLL